MNHEMIWLKEKKKKRRRINGLGGGGGLGLRDKISDPGKRRQEVTIII